MYSCRNTQATTGIPTWLRPWLLPLGSGHTPTPRTAHAVKHTYIGSPHRFKLLRKAAAGTVAGTLRISACSIWGAKTHANHTNDNRVLPYRRLHQNYCKSPTLRLRRLALHPPERIAPIETQGNLGLAADECQIALNLSVALKQ